MNINNLKLKIMQHKRNLNSGVMNSVNHLKNKIKMSATGADVKLL